MLKKKIVLFLVLSCVLRCGFGVVILNNRGEETTESPHENPDHSEENHAFEELLKLTSSQLDDKLDLSSVGKLLHLLNEQCLEAEYIFEYLGLVVEDGIDEHQFENASLLITLYLQDRDANSSCERAETDLDINGIRREIFSSDEVCRTHVSSLIDTISDNGKYVQKEDADECFGSASIISQCTTNSRTIDEGLAEMVINMARGFCLLPDPEYFKEELFEYLGPQDGYASEEALEEFLEKLSLGGNGGEHGDHEEEEENHSDHDHRRKKRQTDDGNENHEDEDHEDEDHGDEDHEDEDYGDEDHEDDHGHEEEHKKCYSASEYLIIAGRQTDADGNVVLSKEGLTSICPALVHQLVTGACTEDDHSSTGSSSTYTTAQKYGYGIASVFIISMLAFGGLLLFPSIGSNSYKLTMQFFIALGVGTLSGDALLHLIPEVVGLHGHGDSEGDAHDHDEEEEDKTYIYRLLVVVVGIYFFYLFENVLRLYNQLKGANVTFHHHDEIEGNHHNHPDSLKAGGQHMIARASIALAEGAGLPGFPRNDEVKKPISEDSNSEASGGSSVCCGVTPVGIMVLIGDVLHNFGDGLALGVAFSSSWVSGVGASIAIFCHELPHEFGDFAIYLKNGMSKWKALLFNFIAACFAFIGLYIGLSVSENPEVREWMLAVIAGMFLYIALVDVLHEMIEEVSKDHPLLQFFLQNLGMCLGWAILLLLALYEDQLRTAIEA